MKTLIQPNLNSEFLQICQYAFPPLAFFFNHRWEIFWRYASSPQNNNKSPPSVARPKGVRYPPSTVTSQSPGKKGTCWMGAVCQMGTVSPNKCFQRVFDVYLRGGLVFFFRHSVPSFQVLDGLGGLNPHFSELRLGAVLT